MTKRANDKTMRNNKKNKWQKEQITKKKQMTKNAKRQKIDWTFSFLLFEMELRYNSKTKSYN